MGQGQHDLGDFQAGQLCCADTICGPLARGEFAGQGLYCPGLCQAAD